MQFYLARYLTPRTYDDKFFFFGIKIFYIDKYRFKILSVLRPKACNLNHMRYVIRKKGQYVCIGIINSLRIDIICGKINI